MALVQTTAQTLAVVANAKTQLTTVASLNAKPSAAQKTALTAAAAALDAVAVRLIAKKSCGDD